MPWLVFDEGGRAVEPIRRFLIDFVARDNRPGSVRSYAFDLLHWWRWLRVVHVEWDRATSAEVRDFVLWLRVTTKPRTSPRTHSAATAGTTNTITKKP
ncbi:site-specific integrase [Streptomyces microflavus]|uniref:site-specific integrase n=1 Tax=Streptomyces microflavus TaxID=1919 RepID=UPI003794FFEC